MEPHEHGVQATKHIERAILGVLISAAHQGRLIVGPAELSRRAGIVNGSKKRDWITQWALARLLDAGMVIQHPGGVGWQVTSAALDG